MLFRKPNRRRKTRSRLEATTAAEMMEGRLLLSAATTPTTDLEDATDQNVDVVNEEADSDSEDVTDVAAQTLEGDGVTEAVESSLSFTESDELETAETVAAESDVVLEWNDLFGDLLVADEINQNPGYASRSMAMLNVAIYDAVTLASGDSAGTFYEYGAAVLDLASGVSAEVAASQAAYTVLSSLYPDQQAMIDSFASSIFSTVAEDTETEAGIAVGNEVGNTVIAKRADDGSDVIVDYTYTDEVGYFQADPLHPDVPVWGPGWGEVETFAISSADDFAPETTPALTSEEYAESYNEVKELGSVDSTVRTAEQTEIGIFWAYDSVGLGTPLALYSDVLETIAIQEGNTLEENAALFAQASVAMADAAIVAWDTKFSEEFWRPVTAIQDGDLDGNALTEGDADWTALGAPDGDGDIVGFTPQFPTYISGHATFGGALFGTLQEFYGTDDISFELTSSELELLLDDPELQEAYGLELDDATRSFDSLSEAMAENGRSRVYLGIHFDFDDLVGQEVGQSVASAVASEFVVPISDDDASATVSVDLAEVGSGDVTILAVDGNLEVVDNRTRTVISSQPLEATDRVAVVGRVGQSDRIVVENLTAADLPGGISVDGGSDRGDTLYVRGTMAPDSIVVSDNAIDVNDITIDVAGIRRVVVDADNDMDTVEVSDDVSFQVSVVDGRRADRNSGRRRDEVGGRQRQRADNRRGQRDAGRQGAGSAEAQNAGEERSSRSSGQRSDSNQVKGDDAQVVETDVDRLFALRDIGAVLDGIRRSRR